MTVPRLLAVMGSGETSPTMVKVHRRLLAALGPAPVPAVLLDTPFGFQGNADELTGRAQRYFRESVGHEVGVAGFRSASEVGGADHERALERIREAMYVFAGPGSPTYALRQWRASLVPDLLRDKLRSGGCLTFASAAALTLGVAVVPVYEIYKVGADPGWEEGLDLLAEAGLRAAVIPHFDNAEGGTHDTRFCYLGEDRLVAMEQQLPEGAFVLGVDEHTALVLDLDAGSASVVGLGTVTVRAGGRSTVFDPGTETTVAELARLGSAEPGPGPGPGPGPSEAQAGGGHGGAGRAGPAREGKGQLPDLVADRESLYSAAMAAGDADAAVQATLDLEAELDAWSDETFDSDQLARGRAALRSMVVRLGQLAAHGARDPATVVGPFVDALLEVRRHHRAERRFADADAVRDALVRLGIEVRDSPAGTEWSLDEGGG